MKLDAAVLLAPSFRTVVVDRTIGPVSYRRQSVAADAVVHEPSNHGRSTLVAQGTVQFSRAAIVRMPLDGHASDLGVFLQDAKHGLQHRVTLRANACASGFELNLLRNLDLPLINLGQRAAVSRGIHVGGTRLERASVLWIHYPVAISVHRTPVFGRVGVGHARHCGTSVEGINNGVPVAIGGRTAV